MNRQRKFLVIGFLFLVIGVSSFTLILSDSPTLFAQSGDTPSANQPTEKVDVCHVPPGNPEQAKKLTLSKSAAQAHLDHGDTVGGCFVKVREIKTQSQIDEFRLDKEGNIEALETENKLKIYEDGKLIKEIPGGGRKRFLLGVGKPLTVLEFQNQADVHRNGDSRINTDWVLYDARGNVISRNDYSIKSHLLLKGHHVVIGNSFDLVNIPTENQIWSIPSDLNKLSHKGRFFFDAESNQAAIKKRGDTIQIIDFESGESMNEKKLPHFNFGFSEGMTHFYTAVTNEDDRSISIKLFDDELSLRQTWPGLPWVGNYETFLSPQHDLLVAQVFEQQQFLIGRISNGQSYFIDQPITKSSIFHYVSDVNDGLLFITGAKRTSRKSYVGSTRFSHIFDMTEHKIVKTKKFGSQNFDFSDPQYNSPTMEIISDQNIIALKFPKRILTYRYAF